MKKLTNTKGCDLCVLVNGTMVVLKPGKDVIVGDDVVLNVPSGIKVEQMETILKTENMHDDSQLMLG